MDPATRITDAEWEVMEALWPRESCTAAEVVQALATARDWTETTIKTMLTRLVKKGVLEASREGRRFHYRAICTRDEAVKAQAGRLLDRVGTKDTSPLLSFFVEHGNLQAPDVAALRELLDQLEGSEEGDR